MNAKNIRQRASLLAVLLLTCLATAAQAGTWWNSDWASRKKITIDTTSTGLPIGDAIGSATVLIRLHDGTFSFLSAKEDGSDLRFVAEDEKTVLSHQVEHYDTLLNEGFVWVRIPEIKPNAKTTIWLYYNNEKAPKLEDAKSTYDAEAVLVYHFGEHNGPPVDSSGKGNTAEKGGANSDASIIGPGLRLDGKSTVNIPSKPSLLWSSGGQLTWSAWFKLTALQPNAVIFSRLEGDNAFVIGADNGVPFVEVKNSGAVQRSNARQPLVLNSWHHLAVVANAGKLDLFLDGEPYAAVPAAIPSLNGASMIGGDAAAGETGLIGEMDQMEIRKTALSPSAIKFEAAQQGGGDKANKLLIVGEDEAPSNWLTWMNTGTAAILIKSLTPDGWAVIIILAIMALVTWTVMITKNSYLNSMMKGNALFLHEWSHLASDLTALEGDHPDQIKSLGGRLDSDQQRAMRNSSVFRIYHIGAEDIRDRIGNRKDAPRVLSARAIQSIRASLDGGLVRETQKLNAQIVFLTLAIAGGPFLGLLGTVIGVMITFASIAAAGDVNVNAIAPGIAAALVATVAGLAVAIPSLFGYNYLLSRIKNVISDLHVFIDEFVTKMAECYSGDETAAATGTSFDSMLASERSGPGEEARRKNGTGKQPRIQQASLVGSEPTPR